MPGQCQQAGGHVNKLDESRDFVLIWSKLVNRTDDEPFTILVGANWGSLRRQGHGASNTKRKDG